MRLRVSITIRGCVRLSIRQSVSHSIRWLVPCYFRPTKIAGFEGGEMLNDQQHQSLMSEEKEVASDLPCGACFHGQYLFRALYSILNTGLSKKQVPQGYVRCDLFVGTYISLLSSSSLLLLLLLVI